MSGIKANEIETKYLILMRSFKILLFICVVLLTPSFLYAQDQQNQVTSGYLGPKLPNTREARFAGYEILDNDTLPSWYLAEFVKMGEYGDKTKQAKMANLRYNVYKVYPYAVEAARIISQIDIELKKTDSRRDRKKYLKALEDQLDAKFKDKLKNLSTTQGTILVKLINRQSGRDVYSVIKELKGGLTARISQTSMYFFDNNLKAQYDPYNTDKDIEMIVSEIEEKAYYNYSIQNTPIEKMNPSK